MVDHYFPETLEEALDLLQTQAVTIMAGGTDLMVRYRNWSDLLPKFDKPLVFINGIQTLHYMVHHEGHIHIGAGVTLEEALGHDLTPELLKKALAHMASPAIRHTGTIAGNIGNASPAGDTLPVLYVLNAQIVLVSTKTTRVVRIEDFILGPSKTDRQKNELIKEIIIENPQGCATYFRKVGGRQSDAISKVCFAGLIKPHGETSADIRMAFGAVGPTIVRQPPIECLYKDLGKEAILERVEADYGGHIRPIDDQRSTAVYRKQCALNIAKDFIETCYEVSL